MVKEKIDLAFDASFELMTLKSKVKNEMLWSIKEAINKNKELILIENKKDLDEAKDKISDVMFKRLELTDKKIEDIISSIDKVIALKDPINEIMSKNTMPNGLLIKKVRVPFGLIASIYESRPNVTIDIAVLALKTGNAIILKGGKEVKHTNTLLVNLMQEAISKYVNKNGIQLVYNREDTEEILTNKKISLLIPRGSKSLIDFVVSNAKVPVIETGAGVCHIYVDSNSDDNMSLNIIYNAKTSNPAVCNAVETVLIHEDKKYLINDLIKRLSNVKFYGNLDVKKEFDVELINEEDYNTEYDDLKLSIKIVKNIDEAIKHIRNHSTNHSDSIISNIKTNQEKFLNSIDSACLYVNASTRFTDGGCFGLGAEVGISTGKLHARGPMGLKELTTYKYKIYGNGQIR